MRKNTFVVMGAVLVFFLVAGAGIYAYTRGDKVEPGKGNEPAASAPAAMKYFGTQRPNFVVRGENLGRVEIWAKVAGQDKLLGTAILQTGLKEGSGDTWLLPIPVNLGATAVYARGYDRSGSPAARMDLAPADLKNL